MQNIGTMTIREIAIGSPSTTRVFEQYKIDYCCHGDTMFDEACRLAGATPEVIEEKIDAVLAVGGNNGMETVADLSAGEVVDHIVATHHVYTKLEIEQLAPLMEKVARKHGGHSPYLFKMKDLFQAVCDDLTPHMAKEEIVLFPYIKRLEKDLAEHMSTSSPAFGTVLIPVGMMKMEHDRVGALLAEMRALSNDYTLPSGACPSFMALFYRLVELEQDLHQHIHLENNILFPRAVELEQKMDMAAGR